MPRSTLSKSLERFIGGGELTIKADRFMGIAYDSNPSGWKTAIANTVKLYGVSGLTYLCKEVNAELSDDEAYSVAREVIRRVTGQAGASWIGSEGDYQAMLAQIASPKGGSEHLTNIASPGLAPGKVAAEPGNSGGDDRTAKPIGEPSWTNTRGRYSATGASGGYRNNPGAFLGGQDGATGFDAGRSNPHSQAHLSHGPVGTAGGTDIRSVRPGQTKPGNVHPKYTSTEIGYSKTGYGKWQKPIAKQVGSQDTYLTSGRAPHILQSMAFAKAVDPSYDAVMAKPRFGLEKSVLHADPDTKYYVAELGGAIPTNTRAKAERMTKGIIKRKSEEDTRTSLAGTREGQAFDHTKRQRAHHTEEAYGDTGDNSEYTQAPYADAPTEEGLLGDGFDLAEEQPAMIGLNEYDESRIVADEEAAREQDDLAAYDEVQAR